MAPAVGGKTKYEMSFTDQVPGEVDPETGLASEGQLTNYNVKFAAPAGVKVEGLAAMGYDWRADGSGKISVSNKGESDSTAQAKMITQVSEIYANATRAAVESSVSALAPILSQYVGAWGSVEQIKANQPQPESLDVNALVQGILSNAPTPGERSGLIEQMMGALNAAQ